MHEVIQHFPFVYVGFFFTLGCCLTLASIKLLTETADYLAKGFNLTLSSKFDSENEYKIYSRISLGKEDYYIVGIDSDREEPNTTTYVLSPTTDPKKACIVLSIKKPLS